MEPEVLDVGPYTHRRDDTAPKMFEKFSACCIIHLEAAPLMLKLGVANPRAEDLKLFGMVNPHVNCVSETHLEFIR